MTTFIIPKVQKSPQSVFLLVLDTPCLVLVSSQSLLALSSELSPLSPDVERKVDCLTSKYKRVAITYFFNYLLNCMFLKHVIQVQRVYIGRRTVTFKVHLTPIFFSAEMKLSNIHKRNLPIFLVSDIFTGGWLLLAGEGNGSIPVLTPQTVLHAC